MGSRRNDLGSITPGKLADLLVLDGEPLDDLRNTTSLRYVIKGGRLYDADPALGTDRRELSVKMRCRGPARSHAANELLLRRYVGERIVLRR